MIKHNLTLEYAKLHRSTISRNAVITVYRTYYDLLAMVISFPNMAALFASDYGQQQKQMNQQYLLYKIYL